MSASCGIKIAQLNHIWPEALHVWSHTDRSASSSLELGCEANAVAIHEACMPAEEKCFKQYLLNATHSTYDSDG